MKKRQGGYRPDFWLGALSALGVIALVLFASSCGSSSRHSGSRTEQATVTKRDSTVTNEQSPTNVAPDRPVVDVKPVGSPLLVARLRQEVMGPDGLDADGDFVAWIDAFCVVHFVRLSDKRQAVVPDGDTYCREANQGPGDLALLGSRAVWYVVGAGMSSANATVSTAAFPDGKQRDLGSGEGPCDSDGCSFRAPIVDSSGGSLVYQLQDDVSDGSGVWRSVSGGFKKVRVDLGPSLAVHGKRIALVDDQWVVRLRRLSDGSLIRAGHAHTRAPGKIGEIALSDSLLVIRTQGPLDRAGEWVDLYETATGQLVRSIRVAADVSPQPFAEGVVFFSDRRLLYAGATAEPVTLATTRGDPVAFAMSGRNALWIEYGRSRYTQRLYSLELQSTR